MIPTKVPEVLSPAGDFERLKSCGFIRRRCGLFGRKAIWYARVAGKF